MTQFCIVAVFDSKIGVYAHPSFFQTRGHAIRTMMDTMDADPKGTFAKHPEDYTLFEIAFYDEKTGTFINNPAPVSLGTLLALKSPTNLEVA